MLTQQERDLAVWRLEQEAGVGEAQEESSNLRAYVSALADPRVGVVSTSVGRVDARFLLSSGV